MEQPLITNLDVRGTFFARRHNQSFLCNFLITRLAKQSMVLVELGGLTCLVWVEGVCVWGLP